MGIGIEIFGDERLLRKPSETDCCVQTCLEVELHW